MRLSPIASFLLAFFIFGLYARASPFSAIKRDNSHIESVLNTLKTTVDPILVQVDELVKTHLITRADLVPLLINITAALDASISELSVLEISGSAPSEVDLANISAAVITNISDQLDAVVIVAPALLPICAHVDLYIYDFCVALNDLLDVTCDPEC